MNSRKISHLWLSFWLEVTKQHEPDHSPTFHLRKQCLLALRSKLGLCIHSADIKGLYRCRSCFGFLIYKTSNNYIANIFIVLIFVASDPMYMSKKMLEKFRQFCYFQEEVNPNTYVIEHWLVGAAITQYWHAFCFWFRKVTTVFPSICCSSLLASSHPMPCSLCYFMNASLACSFLRFICMRAWASWWQPFLGYILIEILMQELLRWITQKWSET